MLLRHYESHKVTKIDGWWWCWWTLSLKHAFEEIHTNHRSIVVQKIHENLLERWYCAYANRHNVWWCSFISLITSIFSLWNYFKQKKAFKWLTVYYKAQTSQSNATRLHEVHNFVTSKHLPFSFILRKKNKET